MRIHLISILFFLSACSAFQSDDSGRYTKSETVRNLIRKPARPWQSIKGEGSDFALANAVTNSIFLFNSSCRKFEASNLNTLTASILTGLNDLEIIERSTTTHQDREAVKVIAKGQLDGITRFFNILTTQKNYCIYDYVLISTDRKNLDKDANDFKKFTQLIELQ